MSTRYEGGSATEVSIEWEAPGAEIGRERLDPGQYAITIGYGEVFYITGTADQLVTFAEEVLAEAQAAKSHHLGPLTRSDFYLDEDHDYICPRCGQPFSPSHHDNPGALVDAIDKHIAVGLHEHTMAYAR